MRAPSPSDILLSALDRRLSLVPCCEGGLGRGQFLFDGIKIRRCLCCNCQRTERFPKLCLSRGYPLVCCLHALFLLCHGIVRKVRCRRRRGGHDVERDGHSEQHSSGSDTGQQDVAAKHQTCRDSGNPTERHGVDQERGDCRPSAGVSAFMRTRPEVDKASRQNKLSIYVFGRMV